jgi:hypothetical protein
MNDNSRWNRLDTPQTGRRVFRWTLVACAGLLLLGPVFHIHGHYAWESWFGFYAVYGFACFFFLVMAAKGFRRVVKRDEEYYERDPE